MKKVVPVVTVAIIIEIMITILLVHTTVVDVSHKMSAVTLELPLTVYCNRRWKQREAISDT